MFYVAVEFILTTDIPGFVLKKAFEPLIIGIALNGSNIYFIPDFKNYKDKWVC